MNQNELKVGHFYSNGAYGRTWGVRQLNGITPGEDDQAVAHFKGIAGTCRRKQGHCSLIEFARWAKYPVALHENDWKRVVETDPQTAATEDG